MPTISRRLLAGLMAVLVVLGGAGFFVIRTGGEAEALVYRYAFKLGDTRTYDLSISMNVVPSGIPDAEPFDGKVHGTVGLDVVDQQEDGSAVIELGMTNMTFEPAIGSGGFDPGKLKLNVAPDGRISSVEGTGGLLGAAGAALNSTMTSTANPTDTASNQFVFPQFPSNKLKPGDTWNETSTMKFPFGGEAITMTVEGRHDGFEDTTYGEAAKVHHLVQSPLDLSFSFQEMFAELGSATSGAIPSQLSSATMKITGDISMDTESLVMPSTSDLIKMDGTLKSTMRMVLEGAPAGAPTEPLAFDATMKIAMLRIDGAA
jgi:hypothetical protein